MAGVRGLDFEVELTAQFGIRGAAGTGVAGVTLGFFLVYQDQLIGRAGVDVHTALFSSTWRNWVTVLP